MSTLRIADIGTLGPGARPAPVSRSARARACDCGERTERGGCGSGTQLCVSCGVAACRSCAGNTCAEAAPTGCSASRATPAPAAVPVGAAAPKGSCAAGNGGCACGLFTLQVPGATR
ncbi:hypothetical protein [Streptomyces sp. NPDC002104]